MKTRKTLITALAVAMIAGVASQAGAGWYGGGYGSMRGPGMMGQGMMHRGGHGPMMGQGMMHRGGHGPMMGRGMMGYGNTAPSLTTEQRQAASDIEAKYADQLAAKRDALRAKADELRKARTTGDTTVAEINKLEDEFTALRQDYWTLRRTVDNEIAEATGTGGYFAGNGFGPYYCAWDNPGPMNGHGPGMGMGGAYGMGNGSYCW